MDSGLLAQQQTEEGIHEPFAAIFGIVDKLEEAEMVSKIAALEFFFRASVVV